MKLKIAICDDEQNQIEYLSGVVSAWARKNRHVAELKTYSSAKSFLFDYAEEKDFDILLLDVEMPGMNGVELAKTVRRENSTVQIVFITGYYEYFSDGFDVSALHYLIKPADEGKLLPVLDRAVSNLSYRQRAVLLTAPKENEQFLKLYLDYFDIPNDMYQGSLAVEKRSDKKYEIEFRHVSFQYAGSENYALKNVNLTFQVGERLAVVGMNGSGKTTFIKLMCRLYDPTEGEIYMNDFNVRKYDYRQYLDLFSVVFQDYSLLALPLGNNVSSAAAWDEEKAERCLRAVGFGERYDEMAKGLETPLYKNFDDEGVNISGGEAQKIALARALYEDAPFIILDEPTAALDPIAEAEIYARFDEIVGDKTAIYISHRLSSCRFCDKIVVFDHGEIVQIGSHEELLSDKNGKYYELWTAQAQYYTK